METPIAVADDTWVLPLPFAIPGIGTLYVNSMVIKGEEPILIDTGAPIFRQAYLDAAFNLVDPEDVRWIFLSHDDRDHSGNLIQVLEACPNARLITNFVGVGRMGEEWHLPMDRINFANHGDRFRAGDRELVAIRPPYYDSPATRGLWDAKTGVYYSADAFGAVVPTSCASTAEVPADAYREGFNWFNRANHPWHEVVDPAKIDAELDVIRSLETSVIVSAHGPAAFGVSQHLCDLLSGVATLDPLGLPSQADLERMMAGMPVG
ncbi:MAG: MBL fold metallo-hydrolase [Acidimicrobiales bacterium]